MAVALLIVGIGLLNVAGAVWAHAVGITSLLAFIVVGFMLIAPAAFAAER